MNEETNKFDVHIGDQYEASNGIFTVERGVVNNLSKVFVTINGQFGTIKIKELLKLKKIKDGAATASNS